VTLSTADRLEILDVIGRTDAAATRRDSEAYAKLFTEDAVLDGSEGRHPAAALRESSRTYPRNAQSSNTELVPGRPR